MDEPKRSIEESIELLRRVSTGDQGAEAELYATCYADLHQRAGALMRRNTAHTLQATALVHEAWMRLSPLTNEFESRRHFLRTATKAMRCVLVDHARAKLADKRGGGARREELVDDVAGRNDPSWRMVALGEAVEALERDDPQVARVVNLRVFGGLTHAEIADVLGVTERTVERYWASARQRLAQEL